MKKVLSTFVLLLSLTTLAACGTEPAATVQPTATTGGVMEATATTGAMMEPSVISDPTGTTAGMMEATATTGGMMEATATTGGTMEGTPGATGGATLADIKARGKLIVGVKYDVPTFGFLNPETNKVEGFDVEMARAVAQQIFGNPDMVEFKEAVSKNRIPYLEQGVVDVVFSTMTANADRAKQIDFSDTYYVAGQSLLVPSDSAITTVKDLAGKTVGTAKGSTSEKNIRAFAPEAKVELFDGYAEAVQAMQSSRVDVVTTDDIILLGFQKKSPDKFKVVGGQFTQEPYGAGIKKGNTELLNEVNTAIREIKQSGKWAEAYKKWLSDTVPPLPPQTWEEVYKTAPVIPSVATTPTP